MFDYESVAGKAFVKDENHRLKFYNWTDTGITLTIPQINNTTDLGKYEGEVATGSDGNKAIIEIKEIFG